MAKSHDELNNWQRLMIPRYRLLVLERLDEIEDATKEDMTDEAFHWFVYGFFVGMNMPPDQAKEVADYVCENEF